MFRDLNELEIIRHATIKRILDTIDYLVMEDGIRKIHFKTNLVQICCTKWLLRFTYKVYVDSSKIVNSDLA